MNDHDKYMHRCIELAKKGIGNVSPNPIVGCIIVHDQTIIGEGYHQKYGDHHAEVNAINSVFDKSQLKKSTLYVSLEPCSHHGKTPPCAEFISKHQIPHVVIGCIDPFSAVNGNGIKHLEDSGIKVTTDILKKECQSLNCRFFTFQEKKRPYIILKWAQTQDGYIDKENSLNNTEINWITSEETQALTHKWRAEEDAILVGKRTIENDNPLLTTRAYNGPHPKRFIIDPDLNLTLDYSIFNDKNEVTIINTIKDENKSPIEYLKVNGDNLIDDLLDHLYKQQIQSIIIEGGAFTINQFIKKDLWDEARVLTGKNYFNKGLEAPKLQCTPFSSFNFSTDRIDIYLK